MTRTYASAALVYVASLRGLVDLGIDIGYVSTVFRHGPWKAYNPALEELKVARGLRSFKFQCNKRVLTMVIRRRGHKGTEGERDALVKEITAYEIEIRAKVISGKKENTVLSEEMVGYVGKKGWGSN